MARGRLLILLLIAGFFAAVAPPASAQPLSSDVVPDQYELHFTLNLQNDTFSGTEQILVEVAKPTTKITLNAVGLTLKQVTVVSGWSSQPATVSTDERAQTATFTLRRRLTPGPARIRIEYAGRLQESLRGLYIGRAGGRKYAATQFEATDARRAFPCFDQPDMKASFLVSAAVPLGDTVISNGRVLSDIAGPEDGQHTVRFATTRKMSTYLLALAVGDFSCLEAQTGNVPIRVCASRGKENLGRFALDAAQSFLQFFDGYFAVKYPFGKLDLVAIPDFLGGGMENVGAIFFDEPDLLVDAQTASVQSQKVVATTIAHEMAHQWLGDLVTMKWWNDLWLKEGFATFFETRPLRAWKPEWHAELDEVASAEQGMAADETASARAVRTNVTTPAEIEALYDPIVYQKAGAILRMVEAATGAEAFRTALNAFIRKYAYSTATAADFEAAIAENDLHGADRVLRAFLDQPGVPLVTVAARCVTDATSSLTLSQQRFWRDAAGQAAGSGVWTIPVTTRPVAPQPGVPAAATNRLLTEKEQAFDLAGCGSLVLANVEGAGYFRAAYPPELVSQLAGSAEARLTPEERLRLLNDQWALAQAGRLDVGDYLALVDGYAGERRAQIVERLGDTVSVIDDVLATDQTRPAFHAWVRQRFAPLARDLEQAGGDNDLARSDTEAKLLMLLGTVGEDDDVLNRARRILMDDGAVGASPVNAELQTAFTALAARNGDNAVFDRIVGNIEHAATPGAFERNILALACFRNPALARKGLEYVLSSRADGHLTARVVRTALDNRAARSETWPFVKSHWKEIVVKTGPTEAAQAVLDSSAGFCEPALRDDLRGFLDSKGLSAEAKARLDRIQSCIDFGTAQRGNFEKWMGKVTAFPTLPCCPPHSTATADPRPRGSRFAATTRVLRPRDRGPR